MLTMRDVFEYIVMGILFFSLPFLMLVMPLIIYAYFGIVPFLVYMAIDFWFLKIITYKDYSDE